jgi:hypothetical protein
MGMYFELTEKVAVENKNINFINNRTTCDCSHWSIDFSQNKAAIFLRLRQLRSIKEAFSTKWYGDGEI